jgi:membrane-bound lytic murein transglycosylase A
VTTISMKKALFIIAIIILLFVFFNGCGLFIKPPGEPVLEQMSPRKVSSYNWTDDLDYGGLDQAIEQSLNYYRRLPLSYRFKYGEFSYSAAEMISSLTLFLDIMNNSHGRERTKQIREKFIFFESKNSEGHTFFTGYYEPVLRGSLVPTEEFPEPLLGTPEDLVKVDLGQFSDKWKNEIIVGRLIDNQLVPYDSREEIVYQESLRNRARHIAYVNEIELFFLQIQGSGLIKLHDGSLMRVNYAQKNGHPYRSIGKVLNEKIPEDKMSLQSLKSYLYSHPDEVRDILNYNQSYVFFREVEEGPLGDIDVPLTSNRSIAMDKRAVPRGSLAYIETELPVFEGDMIKDWKTVKRFVLVQDTGGAIRNHGRVDIFLGHGEKAGMVAGHLKNRGRSFLIAARKEFLK